MNTLPLLLCLACFLATLTLALASRMTNGSTLPELARSRFYEVMPVRGVLWLLTALAGESSLLALYLLIRQGYLRYSQQQSWGASILPLTPLVAATAVGGALCWYLATRWLVRTERVAPAVDIHQITLRERIAADDLAVLGSERFPNQIAPTARVDNCLRALLVLCALGTLGALVYASQNEVVTTEPGQALIKASLEMTGLETAARDVATFMLWTSCGLLLLLLCHNPDYTFLDFRRALVVQAVLVAVFTASLAFSSASIAYAILGFAACILACGGRAARDLIVYARYARRKQVLDPIAEDLRRALPVLNHIPDHPDFRLPSLDRAALARRIERGCVNVEERGIFVKRSFVRFMCVIEVEHQNFAIAMLRYLTVDRYVTVSAGAGTHAWHRHPLVPAWDLVLFPLRPPVPRNPDDGFRDMDDPLPLGPAWDIVQTCSQCGGAGLVWVTETYYETEYYTETYTDADGKSRSRLASRQVVKTRQVQKTCPTCGGSGRTQHQQTLHTRWRSLVPRVTSPEIPMPELVANAEERCYFRQQFTTELRTASSSAQTGGIDNRLMGAMIAAGQQLAAAHAQHTQAVLSLTGGYLYQADLQVCGFRAIRILFSHLKGQSGWFFGRRPEFYFPRLPLCYATIATVILLPPLAFVAALLLLRAVSLVDVP